MLAPDESQLPLSPIESFTVASALKLIASKHDPGLHRSQILREFVSDAGSGRGILRLRRTIPLLLEALRCEISVG